MNSLRQEGLTLLELTITLAVLSILLAVGIPGASSMMASSRRVATINELVSHLHYARSEAVTRNRSVTLCPSTDGRICDGVAWEKGWLVFVSNNREQPWIVGESDDILRIHDAIDHGATLRGSPSVSSFITYRSKGYLVRPGRVTYCDPRAASSSKALKLSYSGNIELISGGDGEVASACL